MRQNPSGLFLVSLLVLVVAIGLFIAYSACGSVSALVDNAATLTADPVPEIAGYRRWSKVNSEPQLMPDRTATLCAPGGTLQLDESKNPHHNKYLTVYVNSIGRKAMLEESRPGF